jgi:glycosyltransferase involved in cell wall biosynthesis
MPTLTAVILTHNEAIDIVECVESCRFCDHIIVFDSNSTDDTRELAAAAGARVHTRAFTNYADQRNAALAAADDAAWVLMIDADERVPADMAKEVRAVADTAGEEITMYRVRRKDFFFGRWMRRATGYPTWFARLIRPTRARFVRDINEDVETAGSVGFLRTHFHHFPFSKGVAAWVDRHNRYSTLEAKRLLAERDEPFVHGDIDLFDPAKRRRLAKRVFYRLPCRPWLAFVGLYLVRGGLWDGWAGLHYCRLRAMYEYMISLKMKELASSPAGGGQRHT